MDPLVAEGPITVRRIERADRAALREIRLEALGDAPQAFGSTLDGARRLSDRQWREKATTTHYFLAERDGAVVGMASGGFSDQYPGTHWLYGMYVTPAARGSGAAELLVRAVSDWARTESAREIHLHVASGAHRARGFYEKNGFTVTGEPFPMERDPRVTMYTMAKSIEGEFRVSRVDATKLRGLRRRVLRQNDPTAFAGDARDAEAASMHFAGLLDGRVVVSASFYPSVAPIRDELASYQLRFMAVDFDAQGHGYGTEVLAVAEKALRDVGAEQLWANARDTALGFYEATGWEIVPGSENISVETQLPHHKVAKVIGDEVSAASA